MGATFAVPERVRRARSFMIAELTANQIIASSTFQVLTMQAALIDTDHYQATFSSGFDAVRISAQRPGIYRVSLNCFSDSATSNGNGQLWLEVGGAPVEGMGSAEFIGSDVIPMSLSGHCEFSTSVLGTGLFEVAFFTSGTGIVIQDGFLMIEFLADFPLVPLP